MDHFIIIIIIIIIIVIFIIIIIIIIIIVTFFFLFSFLLINEAKSQLLFLCLFNLTLAEFQVTSQVLFPKN